MHLVTIGECRIDGAVLVEIRDTDTDALAGYIVDVPDLWRCLSAHRPCQVRVRGHTYALRGPAAHSERLTGPPGA